MAKIDAPVIASQPEAPVKVYVTIPDEDLFEMSHPEIQINGTRYLPGKHYVTADVGGEIERLVRGWAKAQIRLNRPGQDRKVRARMESQSQVRGAVVDEHTDLG